MAKPSLSRREIDTTLAAVNKALKSGHKINGRPSAITEAATMLNLTPSAVHSRLKIAKDRFGIVPNTSDKLGGSEDDRERVRMGDEIRRLTSALREAHREALDEDAFRSILGTLAVAPEETPTWMVTPAKISRPAPEVPVTIWADWHLGEVVDKDEVNGVNEYNMEVAERRINNLVDNTINLCNNHHSGDYPGVVVNLLGDFVSGGLHPELAKTDEYESIPATLRARDFLVAALTKMADTFGKVYCPCTAGNHGRNTIKPEYKRYVYKNFDWMVYQLLIRHFENDKRVKFDVKSSNDVHYQVYGQRYLAVHGDMLGVKGGDGIIGAIGPIMRGEIKKAGQSSALDQDYDMLLMGHWHQQLWLPRAIVSNTIKGFDEYARLKLGARPTRPSQPLWFVHPSGGMTSHWDVWVDEPVKLNKDWVSWVE